MRFVGLGLLAPAGLLFGQAITGTLVGTVTDSSGGVVPDAPVKIEETRTGIIRTVQTNQSGAFVAPSLDGGVYRITIEMPGFRKLQRDNVELLVNTTIRTDLELQPGTLSETINVSAETPALQTDRSDTGRKIEAIQVITLPLGFNRNFQSLLNLVPGATRAFRPHSEFFNPQDALSTRVNGQSRTGNNVQLEGVDNNYRTGLLTALIPPIEAIQTVDITTSNYDAELGRAGGAVTNVMFRSGTNHLHGSAFYYNRVSKLGSRNVFALSKAPTVYNQYGFTIGGPVLKNKLFFFGDFQGIKDRRGDVFRATIPIMAFRAGDLSLSPTAIYDPATGSPDGRLRQPFAGRQIPASRISPVSRRLQDLIPAPTFSGLGTNYETSTVRSKDTNSFDIKGDHQLTSADRYSLRYSFQRPKTVDPPLFGLAGGGGKSFAGSGQFKTQNAAFNYTHIFTPTLLTEARVGLLRYRNDARNSDYGSTASATIGIPGVNISDFSSGLSEIQINGYSNPVLGYSASLPWVRAEMNYNFVSNWTKIRGNHTFKWGADIRRTSDTVFQVDTFGSRGRFVFNPGPTALNGDASIGFGNSFAAFLLDLPSTSARELPAVTPTFLQSALFTYAHDKWQVSQKLTIDLGIRHELWLPATPKFAAGFSNYDPETNTLLLGGVGSVPRNLGVKTYWGGWAPRIGVAYRWNEKTVLRAGYGIGIMPLVKETRAYYNFPVRQNFVFNPLNTFSSAGALSAGFPPALLLPIPADGLIRNPPDQAYGVVRKNIREGKVHSWNVALQRSLPWRFTVEAAYVANHAAGVIADQNLNSGLTPGMGAAGQPLNQKFGIRSQVLDRYFPLTADYHSAQVKFDRKFSNGFLLTTAYTFSKSIDYANDNGGTFQPARVRENRGRADFDATHVFVQSYIYELPFGAKGRFARSGAASWILGGWQVNGILTLQTGPPLNFTFNAATLNAPGNNNRPNITGKPEILGAVGRGELWFDTSRFAAPATSTYGSVGRNILYGPGFRNLDFSLFRRFRLTEKRVAEFRCESFNVTNTPHFNNPTTEFGNANFGQVTTAQQDQRGIQFGLRLEF